MIFSHQESLNSKIYRIYRYTQGNTMNNLVQCFVQDTLTLRLRTLLTEFCIWMILKTALKNWNMISESDRSCDCSYTDLTQSLCKEVTNNRHDPLFSVIIKTNFRKSSSLITKRKIIFRNWSQQWILIDAMCNRAISIPTEACSVTSKKACLFIIKAPCYRYDLVYEVFLLKSQSRDPLKTAYIIRPSLNLFHIFCQSSSVWPKICLIPWLQKRGICESIWALTQHIWILILYLKISLCSRLLLYDVAPKSKSPQVPISNLKTLSYRYKVHRDYSEERAKSLRPQQRRRSTVLRSDGTGLPRQLNFFWGESRRILLFHP